MCGAECGACSYIVGGASNMSDPIQPPNDATAIEPFTFQEVG